MNTSALVRLPESGPPELLYLLFHGVGASAGDMVALAQALATEYPQAAVLCLDAPDPCDAAPGAGAGAGFQWFSVRGVTEANRPERVAAAMPRFVALVRDLQARFALEWERTALVGFSQGAIMALEAVQAEPRLAGRVLAFSGRHAIAPMHAPQGTTVHLLHGMSDPLMPHAAVVDSAERLVALGGDVTADVLPGIGHELHPRLVAQAIEQLRTFLPKKAWRAALSEAPLLPRAASSKELGG